LLTLSSVDSSVKLTRLVVESANAVLAIVMCQSPAADNSDDGSVLAAASNVKDGMHAPHFAMHSLTHL
jgi:hypothetical protein